jgi:hypothetical protein
VNLTLDNYHSLLRQVRQGHFDLPNTDCDTGRPTVAAEYSLADKTYEHLLRDLTTKNYLQPTAALRTNVLAFYSDLNAPFYTKKNAKKWKATERALGQFKNHSETANAPPGN